MTSVVHLPAMTLYGIERTGPSSFNDSQGGGADFGVALWHAFIDELIRLGVPLDQVMYGVSWPADALVPPQHITYFCGVESTQEINGLQMLRFDGGNYFDYRCEVPADDLDAGFQAAYLNALPESGLTPRAGQHLEIYGDDYNPNAAVARFRILIPVV